MKFIKRVGPGEMLPPFYGVAWHDWARAVAVCAPVPLNWLIALSRGLWVFLRHGPTAVINHPRDAYRQGLRDGRQESRP